MADHDLLLTGPTVPGLFDPAGYTGLSGLLVDRAPARFDDVLEESSHG
jgi:3-carboxy-cis,cis-muconate cycloisomerase